MWPGGLGPQGPGQAQTPGTALLTPPTRWGGLRQGSLPSGRAPCSTALRTVSATRVLPLCSESSPVKAWAPSPLNDRGQEWGAGAQGQEAPQFASLRSTT